MKKSNKNPKFCTPPTNILEPVNTSELQRFGQNPKFKLLFFKPPLTNYNYLPLNYNISLTQPN